MSNFGLVYTDIVNAFSGTLVTDFAVGAVTGDIIINNELALQYLKLSDLISDTSFRLTQHVDLEIVDVDVNKNFSCGLTPVSGTAQAWVIWKGYTPCSINDFYGATDNGSFLTSDYYYNGGTPASITQTDVNTFLLNSTFNKNRQQLILSYDVDQTLSDFGPYKTILRDMVAYSLGSRIFPSGSDTWSIVQYYKEQSEKYLDMMRAGNFDSVLGLNLLFKKNAWNSIRITRG